VVALSGESGRADYGRTILRLATELSPRFFPRVAAAVGILETHSPLERRLRMIASTPDRKPARFAAVIVVVLAAVAVTFTNAQPKAGEDETKGQAAGSAAPKAAGEDAAKLPANWPDLKAARAADEEQVRQKLLKDQQVRAQLDRPLPEVNFDEVAFADVIDFFRDVTGANVFVNWKALEGAGVNRTTTVSARLRNVRFSKALTVILDSASGGKAKLGFIIDDGVVTISTAEDLDRGETVTRVYDVRDLIVPIPDYEAPPAVQPPAQAEQRPADPEKEEDVRAKKDAAARSRAVEALTQLLQQTVSPGGWGKTWAMRELQGQFIISAPQRIHEPIVQILDHLRESRGVQVIVETKLISADEVALDALPAGLRERVAGALRTGKEPPKAGRGDAPAAKDPKGVYLSAEQVDLVLKAIQDNPRSQVVSAPRLTLFNGQAAYVLTANQRAYVADYSVVKQQGGGTKYEPVFGTAQSGVMLWVRATTSADRKFATLTLNPRLTYLGGMKDVPWEKSPAGEKMTVQRPEVLVSELATTASVPDGQTLLLGGLREYAASGKSTNVLMLVKPTLITQREIELKQFPLLSPKSGE
jgi:general secretion pathway protein D